MVLPTIRNVLETIVGGFMSETLTGTIIYCVGLFVGAMFLSTHSEMENILGTTYAELSSMKRECELVMPRNQECVASIVFLPTAIEE